MDLELEKCIVNSKNIFQVFDGSLYKNYVMDEEYKFILGLENWKNFITLTFRDFKYPDIALKDFYYLVRLLNEDLFGKNYLRFIKHSYFSYCLGIEYQKRDVIHFHFITDEPLNFKLIHSFWNLNCGFAWTSVSRDNSDICKYIVKYNLKGGHVEIFRKFRHYEVFEKPDWYKNS